MGVLRLLVQGRLRVVQGSVKCVSGIGPWCYNYVLRVLQDKGVSRALQGCFKSVGRVFREFLMTLKLNFCAKKKQSWSTKFFSN